MDIYIGTIQPFAFQWAPRGWMFCSGQILAIASNTALFSLLGTTYGGNGQNTFALPNLNGRTILGQGPSTTGAMRASCVARMVADVVFPTPPLGEINAIVGIMPPIVTLAHASS